jgi:hypothetical protein
MVTVEERKNIKRLVAERDAILSVIETMRKQKPLLPPKISVAAVLQAVNEQIDEAVSEAFVRNVLDMWVCNVHSVREAYLAFRWLRTGNSKQNPITEDEMEQFMALIDGASYLRAERIRLMLTGWAADFSGRIETLDEKQAISSRKRCDQLKKEIVTD